MQGKHTRLSGVIEIADEEIRTFKDEDGGIWYAAADARRICGKPRAKCRPPFASYICGQWPMQRTLQLIQLDALMRFATEHSPIPLREWRAALSEELKAEGW